MKKVTVLLMLWSPIARRYGDQHQLTRNQFRFLIDPENETTMSRAKFYRSRYFDS